MLMAERVGILSLFLDVAFHAAAVRGIKLREIADLHWRVATSPTASSARWPGCFGLVQMERECVCREPASATVFWTPAACINHLWRSAICERQQCGAGEIWKAVIPLGTL